MERSSEIEILDDTSPKTIHITMEFPPTATTNINTKSTDQSNFNQNAMSSFALVFVRLFVMLGGIEYSWNKKLQMVSLSVTPHTTLLNVFKHTSVFISVPYRKKYNLSLPNIRG